MDGDVINFFMDILLGKTKAPARLKRAHARVYENVRYLTTTSYHHETEVLYY